jgi:hypothetical protein
MEHFIGAPGRYVSEIRSWVNEGPVLKGTEILKELFTLEGSLQEDHPSPNLHIKLTDTNGGKFKRFSECFHDFFGHWRREREYRARLSNEAHVPQLKKKRLTARWRYETSDPERQNLFFFFPPESHDGAIVVG